VRVISGSAKGRTLVTVKGRGITRPTGDKVKEAIFDSIQFEIPGSRVLDLFAGSGAIGIEALSGGAVEAVFVDNTREAVAVVEKNLRDTGLIKSAKILFGGYESVLEKIEGTFDFIFIDPPYRAGLYEDVIARIRNKGLLKPGGRMVVEHTIDAVFQDKGILKTKKYGNTLVSFVAGAY
jgi:16S rRNA (guanine(966)-N(2))-methyltransferase RsmD